MRFERVGRPEVKNLMLAPKQFDTVNRDLEIRDLYNMEDFAASPLGGFHAIFEHLEGYQGLPDVAAVKELILSAQVTAAGYARNYNGSVQEIRKAQRVNAAFQQVLDNPDAADALQQPALKPLLDEAAD